MMTPLRPWVLIDVDGVLNPDFPGHTGWRKLRKAGWKRLRMTMPWLQELTVYLHPAHGRMLLAMAADTGAELAWGSAWRAHANTRIGPVIGLPHLPVLLEPGEPADETLWGEWKAESAIPNLGGRPFVWLDDDPGVARAATRLAAQPHLVILVNPREGLTCEQVSRARSWLEKVSR